MTANGGYNPLGPSTVSVGASPFTYTAGLTVETLYLYGGMVSSVTKGGVTLATSSDRVFRLAPNESVIITYSSAPSATADKE